MILSRYTGSRVRRSLQFSQVIYDPIKASLDWDSVEAHENFAKSEKFPPFLASVKSYLAENPIIYHALLRPFPPVKLFESPFIEIRSFKSQDVVQQARMATAVSNPLGSLCHFLGIKHEDPDAQIALIGWQSKHVS